MRKARPMLCNKVKDKKELSNHFIISYILQVRKLKPRELLFSC
jgi:hypothetical protein